MAEREVPTGLNGLVPPEHLIAYLPDDPATVPLDVDPLVHLEHKPDDWHYHHVYFTKKRYNNSGNGRHLAFRGSRYNQVNIRVRNHGLYHREHERFVKFPPIDEINYFLEEADILNRLSAASQGLRDDKYDDEDKEVFSSIIDESISRIDTFGIMPDIVVTGALKRIAIRTGDILLDSIAEKRIEIDPIYLPVYIPKTEILQEAASRLLERTVSPCAVV